MLAPSGDRAVPALSEFWFGIHETVIFVLSQWYLLQVEAGRCPHHWIVFFCVGRTLPVTILLPQCLLQMETGRCPHCLICCIVTMMLAPRGDRAVPASWLWCSRLRPHVSAIHGRLPRNLERMSRTVFSGNLLSVVPPCERL